MSSMDESALYRLKNLNNDNIISVFKDQFKIGRASSKSFASQLRSERKRNDVRTTKQFVRFFDKASCQG